MPHAIPKAMFGAVCAWLCASACIAKPLPAPSAPTTTPPASSDESLDVGEPIEGQCSAPREPSTRFWGSDDFPSGQCRSRALEFVKQMSVEEKVGQMLQGGHDQIRQTPSDVALKFMGSVLSGGGQGPSDASALEWAKLANLYRAESLKTRLGIPILYGIDAVHGHNNVRGAVIFPHNIGLGATRDADLVRRIAAATAKEIRATNIDWTFAPVLAAARDERWGRTYEAFGESYDLVATLGKAAIEGYQGTDPFESPDSVLACAKHFVGDGNTTSGKDQGDSALEGPELKQRLLPAYKAAVDAKVGSVMASFSSVNGVKMHCNGELMTDVLKNELGFNGFIISDWTGVKQVKGKNYAEQLKNSINAGLDMVMHPEYFPHYMGIMKKLAGSEIPMARIDDAVTRILSIKCQMGLLPLAGAAPLTLPEVSEERLEVVGSAAHRRLAREAVRKSLVLLKNEANLLPIKNTVKRVHLAGRFADDLGAQCGGWTISWQGARGQTTDGTTVRAALENAIGKERVSFTADGDGGAGADVAIAVIGEDPYAEGSGDRADLSLDAKDVAAVKALKASGVPTVVLLISGRPMILGEVLEMADAVLVAWLPGSEGDGIADVLLGLHAPTGKLSHSWPRDMGQVPINVADKGYDPLFAYGFGMSYPAAATAPNAK